MDLKSLKSYKILEEREVPDINSKGYRLLHVKTGAQVMLFSNDDSNKVFTIGFRTPPSDSTGVPHIMEHSVLCGSKKYPAKDPFVELAKGSLNTFLNAMTYPDKTVYPVASCNDKDFRNLMNVYLDAVFYPNIYSRPEIFRQEGWHYELDDKASDIRINGVVYNEMKGVFSSADDMLEREVMNTLFPDTPYGFESGGDPEFIPDLTYEQFIEFHQKYYHPSNSYIYLYGDMDMADTLDFIDKEYLSNFDRIDIDSEIKLQPSFKEPVFKEISYSITNEEPLTDNTYLAFNTVIDTSLNKELYQAFQIIEYALLLAPGAILNQTLLDRGIGKDITGSYECGSYQPYFSVISKNANKEQFDEFKATIDEVLFKVATEGFDKKALLAAVNFYEFKFREADFGSYPKGLMYGLQSFDSWLYDENEPFMHIEQNEMFAFLRSKVDTDYFEKLVKKYLIENNHKSYIICNPERGLTAKLDKELADKLAAYKNSLTDEEVDRLVEDTAALIRYQEEPSTKEELESIPLLKISDIKKEALDFRTEEHKLSDMFVLTHDEFTNGIGYLTLAFDISDIEIEMLPYIGALKNVLGLIDTENYGYSDLFNEININTGGITFGTAVYPNADNPEKYRLMFEVRAKVLYSQLSFAFSMMEEVLLRSDFSDEKRIRELIFMLKSRIQSSLVSSGHSTAVSRALSYCSASNTVLDSLGGFTFYRVIEDLCQDYDNKKSELVDKMQALLDRIFCKDNLIVDYIAEAKEYDNLKPELESFRNKLHDYKGERTVAFCKSIQKNEGFKTSSKVQYVAVAGNFIKSGLKYSGALKVLKVMMSYEYLWNNVRVKGGAYGCMNGFGKSGNCYFVSYRDPNLAKTVNVFKEAVDFLKNFKADDRAMTKYIIGAIADLDAPLSPYSKGLRSMSAYLSNETFEQIQKERDEVLQSDEQAIRSLAVYVEKMLEQHNICVVGGEEEIEKNKELFAKVENLIQG